jgi:hypothetical protein
MFLPLNLASFVVFRAVPLRFSSVAEDVGRRARFSAVALRCGLFTGFGFLSVNSCNIGASNNPGLNSLLASCPARRRMGLMPSWRRFWEADVG